MAHGDADALGHALATEGRVAQMFGDEAFGCEQVGGAEGADTVFAGLPGDDAGEQFQHVAFEVLGLAFGGAAEEALGALAEMRVSRHCRRVSTPTLSGTSRRPRQRSPNSACGMSKMNWRMAPEKPKRYGLSVR